MAKLSKTKSFSVSSETLDVDFKGIKCEVANLLKSGLVNQNIILIAFNNVWHEINVLDHGGDNSDLINFKKYVESMNLGLSDFGITQVKEIKDYSLTHEDFLSLQEKFPNYNYVEIAKLNDHNVKFGLKSSIYQLTQDLTYLQKNNITIENHINQSIKEMETNIEKSKSINVVDAEIVNDNLTEIVNDNKTVTENKTVSVTYMPNEAVVESAINTMRSNSEKAISLQMFETLTPDRVSELKGLEMRQIDVVNQNPVIEIVDKESYELAKKTAQVLLKASTAIDGKDGIEATATKYLNTFKSMLKNALLPISKLTRDQYDKQKQIINAWENAEELRIQAEQRAVLEKINKRTNELFAVPFTFNGSVYSIGTVYVLPSQIENLPDNEFAELVGKGIEVKKQLDAEAEIQKNKDAEIEALKAQLAALESSKTKAEVMSKITETFDTTNVVVGNNGVVNHGNDSVNHGNQGSASAVSNQANNNTSSLQPTNNAYSLPDVKNKLLNDLDLKNAEHLEKPAYIKCRGYYVQALIDASNVIEGILKDNTPNTIKKSEQIANICAVWKQSK